MSILTYHSMIAVHPVDPLCYRINRFSIRPHQSIHYNVSLSRSVHRSSTDMQVIPQSAQNRYPLNSRTTWLVQLHTLIHDNSTMQTIQFSHKHRTIIRTRPIDPVVQVVDSKTIRATSAIHCCKNRFRLCAVVGGNCTYMIPLVFTKVDLNQQTIRRTINMQTKCVYKLTMPAWKWKATGTIDSLCLARTSIDFVLRSISLTS